MEWAINDTGKQDMAKNDGEGGGVTLSNDKDNIASLGLALNEFVKLNPFMPVSQIVAFLLVALETDMSIQNIQERVCIKKSTASKHLIELGLPRIEGDGNFGLVERRVNPSYPREARFVLTRKGRAMIARVLSALERGASE
jgi:DNA-binding MarR family transcriptional regulator